MEHVAMPKRFLVIRRHPILCNLPTGDAVLEDFTLCSQQHKLL